MVNISQQATVGYQLAQLKAIDLDDGVNGEITYSIVHGNEEGYFEVDPLNGALYLAKSLHHFMQNETNPLQAIAATHHVNKSSTLDERWKHQDGKDGLESSTKKPFYQHRLVLKASDRGQPRRSNTTVLDILIFAPSKTETQMITDSTHRADLGRHGTAFTYEFGRIVDQDLVIMVVLIALTSIISVILILAICLIRCRQLTGSRRTDRSNDCGRGPVHTITKKAVPDPGKTWWDSSLTFAQRGRKHPANSEVPELCDKNSTQDLYVLSPTVCDDELRRQDPLHETTGRSTPGTEAYFTICPGTWNSRTGTKMTTFPSTVRECDPYRTLNSTPDKLSNTYVVELNPQMFDQTYALIRPQPCTSSTHENVHYQTLYTDKLVTNASPSHRNTCSVKHPVTKEIPSRNQVRSADVELQPMDVNTLLHARCIPSNETSPCRTCDEESILRKFESSNTKTVKSSSRTTDDLEC
ncbi:hypothetical protein FGIG_04441 [Fasciola gigantica]|uniref:Cadherin domain-containing protein n=1 Tax=Fasciola gigantica TaxID=46835 RepID=A0A504YPX2_FASGI|nr:hypothetical protein FGIG_04441 [Fasciola gigantica]